MQVSLTNQIALQNYSGTKSTRGQFRNPIHSKAIQEPIPLQNIYSPVPAIHPRDPTFDEPVAESLEGELN